MSQRLASIGEETGGFAADLSRHDARRPWTVAGTAHKTSFPVAEMVATHMWSSHIELIMNLPALVRKRKDATAGER